MVKDGSGCGKLAMKRGITFDIFGLAILPIDYQHSQRDLFEQFCGDREISAAYREVFTSGIRGYQLAAYLTLVRQHYNQQVADQVWSCQRRLLDSDTADSSIASAMDLIREALDSRVVTAITEAGSVKIPIEMNVALSLLLGMPESPDFVEGQEQRVNQISRMGPDVDWVLSHCLARAHGEMLKTFSPLLAWVASIRKSSSDDGPGDGDGVRDSLR